jgi:hypothetical protein
MSFDFNFAKKKQEQTTNQSSRTDPYGPTQPYIKSFLSSLDQTRSKTAPGPDEYQQEAANQLRKLGLGGNRYTDDMDKLARDLFSTTSRAGELESGYGALEKRLTPTADGTNLDIRNNPFIADMLTRSGDDVAQRINAQFAGAGRDLSGYNQRAVGEGVSRAQLPIMFDQFNREQGRTDAAGRDLFAARTGTTMGKDAADRFATDRRGEGVEIGKQRMEMDAWGPQMVMQLQQQLKDMPYDDLKKWAEMLFSAAGLGGTSSGTSTTKGDMTGFGFGGTTAVNKPK